MSDPEMYLDLRRRKMTQCEGLNALLAIVNVMFVALFIPSPWIAFHWHCGDWS